MTVIKLTLVHIECAKCGMIFGMTETCQAALMESHDTFCCPKGHSQLYNGKSESQQLRDELAREKQRAEQTEADLSRMLNAEAFGRKLAEKRHRAEKAANTRLKNRIKNGVCPCCSRSFENVRRHIATKHPNFNLGDK